MPKELKKEQKDAISLEKNLIVPANAGSGKTFVMLNRVAHFVADKNQSVLDFLLITFTDAAASQMQSKLQQNLLNRFRESSSFEQKKHIKEELNKLTIADISTIHTFCYKIIKKYFYVVGISANSSICDEDMADSLKEKAMQLTLNHFSNQKDEDFLMLLKSYDTKRNFETIREMIYKIFNALQNQIEENSFEERIEKVYTEYQKTSIASVINNYITNAFDYFIQKFENLKTRAQMAGCSQAVKLTESVLPKILTIKKENSFLENHNLIFKQMVGFSNKPSKVLDEDRSFVDEYGILKADLVAEIKNIKEKVLLNEDVASLKQDLLWCKTNVLTLVKMEKFFKEKYDSLKRDREVLDFSDLEHFAYKILSDEKVCDEIKKTYKQIFVDEYQDVNDVQEAIIQKISGKENTLFLVGDPKQSIYRFRNTNPQIMLNKLKDYESGEGKQSIPLYYNFRSDENILNFSNFLFSQIMTKESLGIDYKNDGMFECGINYPKTSIPSVELCVIPYEKKQKEKVVPTDVYSVMEAELEEDEDNIYAKTEADFIASKISTLLLGGTKIFDPDCDGIDHLRQVEYKDIAILYRSKGDYLETILNRLKEYGIPVKAQSSENVLDTIEVQVLLNYLKLLVNTQDDYALTSFLTSPIISLSFDELSSLSKRNDESFCEIIKQKQNENGKIKKAFNLIEEGRLRLLNETIYDVLTWLCEKTSYKCLLLSMEDGDTKLENVKSYIDDFLGHSYNHDIVEYLSFVEENEKIDLKRSASGESDAISVLTMHHSKGLEFPICFVCDMAHEFNTRDQMGPALFSPTLGIGVQKFDRENRFKQSTIARSAIIVDEKEKSFGEEMRVLYVGLTRAKNHLYVIGKAKLNGLCHDTSFYALRHKQDYMSIILSCLKDELIESMKMGKEVIKVKTGDNTNFVINVLNPNLDEEEEQKTEEQIIDFNAKSILDEIKQTDKIILEQTKTSNIAYKTSVSRIMEKEDSKVLHPQSVQKLLVKDDNITPDKIGTAYHKAMEVIPFNIKEQDVETFLRDNLEFEEFKLINIEKIKKCLNWLKPIASGATNIIREGQFYLNIPYNQIVKNSNVSEKVLIQGVVDLVIEKNDEVILIDYKTNRFSNPEFLREKYEIQLQCYKIAVENAIKKAVSHKILYSFFKDCEILFDK